MSNNATWHYGSVSPSPRIRIGKEMVEVEDINDPFLLELYMSNRMKWCELDDTTRQAILDRYQHLKTL